MRLPKVFQRFLFIICCFFIFLNFAKVHAESSGRAEGAGSAANNVKSEWQFVYISDTHLGFTKTDNAFEQFSKELFIEKGKYAFLIHTGDVTELGTKEAFALYRQKTSTWDLQTYSAIGNHDVRWSPSGKKMYKDFLGPTYYSFNYNGVHFVVLDSTIVHQTQGHIDEKQLEWLAKDISGIPAITPVFVFTHHPVRWTGISIDNGYKVIQLLERFTSKVFFHGHSHNVRVLSWNGMTFVQNGALFNNDYMVVKVVNIDNVKKVIVEAKTLGNISSSRTVAEIPLETKEYKQMSIVSPKEETVLSKFIPIMVSPGSLILTDAKAILNGNNSNEHHLFSSLVKKESGMWMGLLNLNGVDGGWQLLRVEGRTEGDNNVEDPEGTHKGGADPEDPGRAAKGRAGRGIASWDRWLYFQNDVDSPKEVWRNNTGEIYVAPVTSKDLVIAANIYGNISAFDQKDKTLRWQFDAGGGVYASPLVIENGRAKSVFVATDEGKIYRLSLKYGKVEWKMDLGSSIYGGISSSDRTLFCNTGSGELIALSIEDGKILWKTTLSGFTQATPQNDGSLIFLGVWGNKFYSVEEKTGNIIWQKHIGKSFYYSPGIATPYVNNDKVIVPAKDNQLYAYNKSNGNLLWSIPVSAGYSSPIGKDGVIYLATQQGKVMAIEEKTGKQKWEASLGTPFYESSPVIINNDILISSLDGELYLLSDKDGSVKWKYNVSRGYVIGTPVVRNGYIWVGSMDGTLYCLKY